jgi:hypothetical protein
MASWIGDQQVLMPMRAQFGRMVFYDMTWTLPWGDLGEFGKGPVATVTGMSILPRQLEPSNPFLHTGIAALTGRDMFTGKELKEFPGDDFGPALARYTLQTWGPALLNPWGRSAAKMERSWKADVNDPDTPSFVTSLFSEAGGIKFRPHDPRQGAEFQEDRLSREIGLIKTAINKFEKQGRPVEELKAEKEKRQAARKLIRMEKRELPPDSPLLKAAKAAQKRRSRGK